LQKPNKENDQRRNAITSYRVLDSNNKAALVELQPKTGFQHQLRAHLAFGIGCPVLGDHKYSHHIKNAPQVRLQMSQFVSKIMLNFFFDVVRNYQMKC
jgi:23S rRNA-/tRNA-specific pseudouridylate synthase